MLKTVVPFFKVAGGLLRDIVRTFRSQVFTRGYLLALAIFLIAVFFCFLALNPALYSFVYPLF